jgi:hypothetical protein
MGCNESSATIQFPASFLDDEIRDCLVEHENVDIALGDPVGLGDTEIHITDGIFRLHSQTCYGQFEELEELLVEKGIPFDRESNMDWGVDPVIRVFRPGVGDKYIPLGADQEPTVAVAKILELLDGKRSNTMIRRYLSDNFWYLPLAEWVKPNGGERA